MKTRNVVLSALVALFVTASAFANEPVSSQLVVVNQKSGTFKVIYKSPNSGKVSMKIIDRLGNQWFSETFKTIKGFSRPVNFDGMEHGVYTIEITDSNGTLVEKVNYKDEPATRSVYVSKTSEEGKYLLAVSHATTRDITVRIYDGENNLVHSEIVEAKDNLGIVYNLKQIPGTPVFEVTDFSGNDLIIK